jgi:L-amino acid N-acyltransferase YncA
MIIRPSTPDDVAALTAVYAWNVRNGTGTFETEAPTEAEMAARREAVLANGWPWLVAEAQAGQVLGYAYANQFRPRMAFRYTLEDAIYLAPEAQGQGIGRLLLAELLARCEARGARQMFAVIGDAANAGSLGLHRACGFVDTGRMHAAGWKFDRWIDVVFMQKSLGPGSSMPAEDLPPPDLFR